MEILNPMGSATSSFLRNAVKLGTMRATKKRRRRDLGETWTKLIATTLDRNATIL